MPSVEPTSQPALMPVTLVPHNLLQGGEIVVLALKPSLWFVPLTSLPTLLASGIVALAAFLVECWRPVGAGGAVSLVCTAIALARVAAASWVWLGRTYVLTNFRFIAIAGLLQFSVRALMLHDAKRGRVAGAQREGASFQRHARFADGILVCRGRPALPRVAPR